MENKLTNLEVMKFLGEVKQKSSIEFLEEGKEKNDLIASAKKRGILAEGSRDLGLLKTIFLFTDTPNANGAIIPSKEFKQIFPQIIGKPMDVGHDRRIVVGYYIDYKYILKENKAITYAVMFKSNFPDVYQKAKEFQKKGKLSSSFEIWSEDKKTVSNKDGTYSLNKMELAGGALIFEENGEEPAFKDAKVLAMAKKDLEQIVDNKCLVLASKYKCENIITANKELKCSNCGNCKSMAEVETIVKPTQPIQTTSKIKCSNCEEEFEYNGVDVKVKCPKCFAILNKEGVMQYPPQIKDFKMLCPSCRVNNFLILSKKEDTEDLRCLQCSKEYRITFDMKKPNELIDKLTFVYVGSVSCYQCGYRIDHSGVSSVKEREFECPKCKLNFSYNIAEGERYKKISKIQEIKKKNTSEQGGNQKMDKKKEVKASEKKVEEIKIESKKDEAKAKIKETPKVEVTPKTEKKDDKVETKKEVKVEEKEPVKEEVKDEKKVENVKVEDELKVEAKVESKEEKVDDKVKEQPEVKAKVKTKEAPKAEEKVKDKPIEEKKEVEESKEEKTEVKTEVKSTEEKKVEKPKVKKVEETKPEETKEEKIDKAKDDDTFEIDEANEEFEIEDNEKLEDEKAEVLPESAQLTTEQRKAIPDRLFAVVVRVKDKRTGDMRKVRMFPIHDEAHVRNALARLGQSAPQATLRRLGVSVESVRAKILRRARQLKMTELLERHKASLRRLAKRYLDLKKSMKEQIEFYKENGAEIAKRKEDLGKTELTDNDILDDEKFAKAKADKENASIEKAELVGKKSKDNDYYKSKRQEIDDLAYKNIK